VASMAAVGVANRTLILVLALIAVLVWTQEISAIETPRRLANYCRILEKGVKGTGRHLQIPKTKKALLCWGYMEGMQDLSVITDQDGTRIMGSCPPEHETLLQLIHTFVAYARSHPKEFRGNTAVTVIKVMRQAYPCSNAVQSADAIFRPSSAWRMRQAPPATGKGHAMLPRLVLRESTRRAVIVLIMSTIPREHPSPREAAKA
jgi:hypothetical protein